MTEHCCACNADDIECLELGGCCRFCDHRAGYMELVEQGAL